jgi:hypothetical protein
MKTLKSLLLSVLFLVLTTYVTGENLKVRAWHIPEDVLGTHNQLSFNQGAKDVWYFMESLAADHDPLTYKLLHDYEAPCDNLGAFKPVVGGACWEGSHVLADGQHSPFITVNFTDHPLPISVDWPAESLFLNPSPESLAIVAWKSPDSGRVRVMGSFAQFNATCGNGIRWSVDKGGDTLASGDIASGGGSQTFDLKDVTVKRDDVLYFTVDSLGDRFCDEAPLNITITMAKK